jgi:hypothetical protein
MIRGRFLARRVVDVLSILSALWAATAVVVHLFLGGRVLGGLELVPIHGGSGVCFGAYLIATSLGVPIFLALGLRRLRPWWHYPPPWGVVVGFTIGLWASSALVTVPYLGVFPSLPSVIILQAITGRQAFEGDACFSWLIGINLALASSVGWLLAQLRSTRRLHKDDSDSQ